MASESLLPPVSTSQTPSEVTTGTHSKEIRTLILDTGPIIQNLCSPTSLLSKSEVLVTLPSVVSEIRDATTRSRFDTLWAPFLRYRSPKSESVKYVSDFARKTGDFGVLSATDLQVLALAYEVECENLGGVEEFKKKLKERDDEKNKEIANGDEKKKGRRRRKPKTAQDGDVQGANKDADEEEGWTTIPVSKSKRRSTNNPKSATASTNAGTQKIENPKSNAQDAISVQSTSEEPPDVANLNLNSEFPSNDITENEAEITTDSEDDWITPDNLPSHLNQDVSISVSPPSQAQITTACCTTDFAMQNVLLQLHIHLYSPTTMSRIISVKSHVLRCHACFKIVRDMNRQFCPSCGQPTLARVTCSTDEKGVFRIHLKKNWQWNNKGNVFSMSKPQHGTPSMKGVKENIVLSEDQKEYEKAMRSSKKFKERDLMDQDYLPGLLTGERLSHGGNPKIGPGRNVNAPKRHIK